MSLEETVLHENFHLLEGSRKCFRLVLAICSPDPMSPYQREKQVGWWLGEKNSVEKLGYSGLPNTISFILYTKSGAGVVGGRFLQLDLSLNDHLGRAPFENNWLHFLVSRLYVGIAIVPNTSTRTSE